MARELEARERFELDPGGLSCVNAAGFAFVESDDDAEAVRVSEFQNGFSGREVESFEFVGADRSDDAVSGGADFKCRELFQVAGDLFADFLLHFFEGWGGIADVGIRVREGGAVADFEGFEGEFEFAEFAGEGEVFQAGEELAFLDGFSILDEDFAEEAGCFGGDAFDFAVFQDCGALDGVAPREEEGKADEKQEGHGCVAEPGDDDRRELRTFADTVHKSVEGQGDRGEEKESDIGAAQKAESDRFENIEDEKRDIIENEPSVEVGKDGIDTEERTELPGGKPQGGAAHAQKVFLGPPGDVGVAFLLEIGGFEGIGHDVIPVEFEEGIGVEQDG